MNSLTITAHGEASGERHGRSRAERAYQARTGVVSASPSRLGPPPGARGPPESVRIALGCLTVASLFEPVGPLDRRVYWRRRALVIAVVVVILLIVLRACTGGDSPDSNPTSSTGTPTSSASASTTKTPKATSSASATSKASASATKTATAVPNC